MASAGGGAGAGSAAGLEGATSGGDITYAGCDGLWRQLCKNGGTSVSSNPYSRCRLVSPIAFSQYDLQYRPFTSGGTEVACA